MSNLYTVRIYDDEDGGYFATVDKKPGTVDQGDTVAEVLHNIGQALEFTLECEREGL